MTSRSHLPARTVLREKALSALAVPVRLALLNHLLAAGPRTATQCARSVGASPSNCSWHLRELAAAGLVEHAPGLGDGRSRPWRAVGVGYEVSDDLGPAGAVAAAAIAEIGAQQEDELFGRHRAARPELSPEWRSASDAASYTVQLSAAELELLRARVDALIRPFVRPIRTDAPADAAAVHVTFRAFLDPQLAGG